ncbi:MAG: ABC transporter permease [Cyclobacteriaceae bacterium]
MAKSHPPKWARKFLQWFCREDFLSEIEGDLFELYYLRTKSSNRSANLFFIWNVLRSFRPMNLKTTTVLKSSGMLRNYFKIGFRSLLKDRKFSIINLAGLSLGLSIFLTIMLLVQHELTFDKFHSKSDRIYQVIQEFQNADGPDPEIFTSLHLSQALRNDLPIVENAVTVHGSQSTWVQANGKRFFEEEGIISGPEFFEIFDFELKYGEPKAVLSNKRSIVLTESLAMKFFDYENPVGKEINLDSYGRFTVSGVMRDVPENSYIQFEFLITQDYDFYFGRTANWYPEWFQSWEGNGVTTYVLLDDSQNERVFESQVSAVLAKNLGPDKEINRHYLLGLEDLHFGSHGIDGRVNEYVKGDYKQVQFLIGVAIMILAMACFNYINISTARYTKRTREVGVRKAMGAHGNQVTNQFLIESFIMVVIAFSLGLILVWLLLPYFSKLTGIDLTFDGEALVRLSPYFAATILLVTVLAGFYPAFHLSRFSVINVLKNATVSGGGNGYLRKGLVTVQYVFVISMVAILVVVNKQYSFMSSKSLGFDTEELVVVEVNGGGVRNNFGLIKNEMQLDPNIMGVTGMTRMIGGYRSGASVQVHEAQVPEENQPMRFFGMDSDGLTTLNIEVLRGVGFSGNERLDSASVLLNEVAAEKFGGAAVIGKSIELVGDDGDELRAKVIGITNDFHSRSLHESISPVVLGYLNNQFQGFDDIVIKLSGSNTMATLESIEKIHNKYDENDVMTWEFMDDMTQRAYEKELIFRDIFVGASLLSFCIAILGLIGLTSYNVVSKTKEIGIRKILGASFLSILNIEAKEQTKYLGFSALVSIPVSWWLAYSWLQNFEYRIAISPVMFAAVVLFILLATCLTVWLVGRKVAASPPIEAIRYE